MKTVVGIDPCGNYDSTLRLLSRLNFADNQLELVTAVEMVPSFVSLSPMPVPDMQGEAIHGLDEAAKKLLTEAKTHADQMGLTSETFRAFGNPISSLTERADELQANLIAIGPSNKSTLETFFAGSTIQGLTNHSQYPILFSRPSVRNTGPVEALLATDHSEYFDRCLHELLHAFPSGITKVHVLYVAPVGSLNDEAGEPTEFAQDVIVKNNRIVEHIKALGVEASSMVIEGEPNHVIVETMQEVHAELLILGARGHNMVERMLGSVSSKQATTSFHPVWVLRTH